jgi:hypothetical protein
MLGIQVVNRPRRLKGTPGAEYIARPNGTLAGSPLGNPRHVGHRVPEIDRAEAGVDVWTAGATLTFYERELRAALGYRQETAYWGYNRDGSRRVLTDDERRAIRDEIERLYNLWRESGELLLDCYCKGKYGNRDAPCHGDCVARVLLWIRSAKQRLAGMQAAA